MQWPSPSSFPDPPCSRWDLFVRVYCLSEPWVLSLIDIPGIVLGPFKSLDFLVQKRFNSESFLVGSCCSWCRWLLFSVVMILLHIFFQFDLGDICLICPIECPWHWSPWQRQYQIWGCSWWCLEGYWVLLPGCWLTRHCRVCSMQVHAKG